jgi:hypothetical protein
MEERVEIVLKKHHSAAVEGIYLKCGLVLATADGVFEYFRDSIAVRDVNYELAIQSTQALSMQSNFF